MSDGICLVGLDVHARADAERVAGVDADVGSYPTRDMQANRAAAVPRRIGFLMHPHGLPRIAAKKALSKDCYSI